MAQPSIRQRSDEGEVGWLPSLQEKPAHPTGITILISLKLYSRDLGAGSRLKVSEIDQKDPMIWKGSAPDRAKQIARWALIGQMALWQLLPVRPDACQLCDAFTWNLHGWPMKSVQRGCGWPPLRGKSLVNRPANGDETRAKKEPVRPKFTCAATEIHATQS